MVPVRISALRLSAAIRPVPPMTTIFMVDPPLSITGDSQRSSNADVGNYRNAQILIGSIIADPGGVPEVHHRRRTRA